MPHCAPCPPICNPFMNNLLWFCGGFGLGKKCK
jgi:hypothetical protein